jgi:type IV pilus assembly protein PilB
VPSIHLDDFDIEPDTIALVGKDLAVKHRVIPVNRAGRSIVVAIADLSNRSAIRAVRDASGLSVEVTVASERAITRALGRYYDVPAEGE